MRPVRGGSKPMMLFSSVVLPTPLRPIRQTTLPASTSKSMSRRICVSPYDTDSFWISSMGCFVLSEIDFDHLGVVLHLIHGALAKSHALVEDRHGLGDLADERHVMFDDQ